MQAHRPFATAATRARRGPSIAQLSQSTFDEDQPAVEVDGGAEERRNVRRPREGRRRKAKHVLHHPAPQNGRDAEQQRDPEPVPEHRDAVPFMTVVCARLAVTGVSRRSVLFVAGDRHVGRVWHRVMVIVQFRRGLVHSGAPITSRRFRSRARCSSSRLESPNTSCSSRPGNREEEGALFSAWTS